ncbi:SDR family NAD(P)-dependent oxidoreductase, partial [Limnohabitans sp.]|uniref:SDR family NAD(P)-dependent oxidoreductase n=1 Tax=Limnohabitans sp. TaxID=1907725 RepID=UPI0039BC64D2|nr:SDR family oxidoreductase [Comamonadaceae bacterium]
TPLNAFVTGAAQGIGLAIAKRLAQDGFHVVAMDRQAEVLAAALKPLQAQGLRMSAAVVDVCDRASVHQALQAHARVDVMVCAAGIYNDARFLELTEQAFTQMLQVNVVGTFIPAQEAARRMVAGGRIVTISSRGALGGTRFAHYVASKSAVVGLTRAMAMELRDKEFAQWEALEPRGKAASPDEIAHAVSFLASPQTHFITGQTLFVDGGKSLGGLSI